MTTELTKAAQQALEPMTILSDDDILRAAESWREFDAPDGVDPVGRMIYGACRSALNEYLRRARQSIALTQRPAAQEVDDGDVTGQPGPLPETGWDEVPEGAFRKPSPTAGMNLGERIKHVGGRENAAGYIEFGSVAAVRALVRQYLRDLPAPQQATQFPLDLVSDPSIAPGEVVAKLDGKEVGRVVGIDTQQATPDHFPDAKEMVQDQNTIKKMAQATPGPVLSLSDDDRREWNGAVGLARQVTGRVPVKTQTLIAVAGLLAATPEPGLLKTFLAEADRAGITRLPATFAADLAAATPEPVGEPFKVEQCMQVASDEFDVFLIGGCTGEPPRMSMAFASTLFKTIIRERGMFFPATPTQQAAGEPVGEPDEYQARLLVGNHKTPWSRVSKDLYERTLGQAGWEHRTLFTHPAPAVPVTDADALLDFMEAHRVSVTPEYEGPWCAQRYDDEPQFVVEAEGATPREALRALAAAQAKGG